MFPFREDLVRFDFEVGAEDEWMCEFGAEGRGVEVEGFETWIDHIPTCAFPVEQLPEN